MKKFILLSLFLIIPFASIVQPLSVFAQLNDYEIVDKDTEIDKHWHPLKELADMQKDENITINVDELIENSTQGKMLRSGDYSATYSSPKFTFILSECTYYFTFNYTLTPNSSGIGWKIKQISNVKSYINTTSLINNPYINTFSATIKHSNSNTQTRFNINLTINYKYTSGTAYSGVAYRNHSVEFVNGAK